MPVETATPKDQSDALHSNSSQPVLEGGMHVKIYAPFKIYYDGMANSVSAINDTGPFDVLARHHNFMTLLNPCDIKIRGNNGQEETITIARGIMHVKANEVVVFLDV